MKVFVVKKVSEKGFTDSQLREAGRRAECIVLRGQDTSTETARDFAVFAIRAKDDEKCWTDFEREMSMLFHEVTMFRCKHCRTAFVAGSKADCSHTVQQGRATVKVWGLHEADHAGTMSTISVKEMVVGEFLDRKDFMVF
jgi:hypothetical protein